GLAFTALGAGVNGAWQPRPRRSLRMRGTILAFSRPAMLLRRIQPLLLLGSGLLLSACGDAGLNVQGVVEVESADGTIRRMEFREETRLDGTGPARFTGSCLLRRTGDAEGHEQWGAIVEIRSGGTVGPGMDASPLTSVTIMQSTASAPAGARVDIEL